VLSQNIAQRQGIGRINRRLARSGKQFLISVKKSKVKISSLPYNIEFQVRPGYLYARVQAPVIKREIAYSYLAEIVTKCADLRVKKLVLERDIPAVLDDEEMFAAMDDLVRMSKGMRVALVNRHISVSRALERIVNLGVGKGADYGYFTDPQDAEKWLLDCG
jgi:hypothetical protein